MRCVTVPKLLFLSRILFDDVKARSGCSPQAIVVRAEPLMCCRPIFFTWPDHIYCCKPPCCVHIVRHTCTVFDWSSHFNWIYAASKRSYTFLHLYFPTVLVYSFMGFLSHQLPAIFICYLLFLSFNATVRNFMPGKTDCVLTVSQYCKYKFWLGIPPRYVDFPHPSNGSISLFPPSEFYPYPSTEFVCVFPEVCIFAWVGFSHVLSTALVWIFPDQSAFPYLRQ